MSGAGLPIILMSMRTEYDLDNAVGNGMAEVSGMDSKLQFIYNTIYLSNEFVVTTK